MMRAWEDFLEQQEGLLGKETVDKWLRSFKVVQFDACNLYLEADNSFQISWFEEHVRTRVQKTFYNNNHKQIKVHLSVAAQQNKTPTAKQFKKPHPQLRDFSLTFDQLDHEAVFDHYIVSDDTLLPYKLLHDSSVASEVSPPLFNPVYLYGRSGTGKTHLMMATADLLQKKGKKALYVRAETFTQHVVDAIRTAEMQAFRKEYRGVDALLIDHVEIFARKMATQEEFFHTFNALHLEGKLIVLSSTVSPKELKLIEPRLISRFEWGIVIPLQMPTKELMRSILVQRAGRRNIALNDTSLSFLLNTFGGNTKNLIRALDALVLRLHLYPSHLKNSDFGCAKTPGLIDRKRPNIRNMGLFTIDQSREFSRQPKSNSSDGLGIYPNQLSPALPLKTIQSLLKDLIADEQRAVITPEKIIKAVSEYYGIRVDDILSKSQSRDCALPRQIAMHLCRQQLNLPFMKIGELFSRDHSTVMTSVKQIQKALDHKNHDVISPMNEVLKLLER